MYLLDALSQMKTPAALWGCWPWMAAGAYILRRDDESEADSGDDREAAGMQHTAPAVSLRRCDRALAQEGSRRRL